MTQPVLLMTRPRQSAERFVARLDQALVACADVVYSPLIRIVPLGSAPALDGYAGVIFSSANGVEHAAAGEGRLAYCVGDTTRRRAEMAGWRAKLAGQTAEELIATLPRMGAMGPLLHLAGRHRRGDIAENLTAAGLTCDVTAIYDQLLQPLTPQAKGCFQGKSPVLVPLFSPRTSRQLDAELPTGARAIVVTLSAAVADPIRQRSGIECHVAAAPTGSNMIEGVENLLRRTTLA
tara:strand:+ start:5293 stop:5997 length:705 start_codon:yes stop_codon:yes gene_type:complete